MSLEKKFYTDRKPTVGKFRVPQSTSQKKVLVFMHLFFTCRSIPSAALIFLVVGWQAATADAPLRVGFAMADITPPIGYRMAGGYHEVISTGVHDPLFAKAMVVDQGEVSFALVVCDVCGVPEPITTAARIDAEKVTGIPRSHIVISATHTHGAPEYWGPLRDILHQRDLRQRGKDEREMIDFPALLAQQCVAAIREAQQQLMPASAELVIARQDTLAFNRRYVMRDGSIRFNPGKGNPDILHPAGPTDPSLPFLLFRPASGEADRTSEHPGKGIGGLSIFAMHTAIFGSGPQGPQFGADFPGHLQRMLRSDFGEEFISIFGEGTAGDINHINARSTEADPTPEQAAQKLVQAIRDNYWRLVSLRKPSLAVKSAIVWAPITPITANAHQRAKSVLEENKAPFLELVAAWRDCHRAELRQRYGEAKPLEIQVVRWNHDTVLVTLPHEVFVEIGLSIKAASPFRNTLVLSLANDIDYYIPTRRAFEEGSYEVTTCPLEPGCGELMIEAAVRLMKELK